MRAIVAATCALRISRLPCGDPNCAAIGYLLKVDGQVRSVSDFIDFTNVQGFLHTRSVTSWKT